MKPSSHEQTPAKFTVPCPPHVTASLYWHALPLKPSGQVQVPLPVIPSLHVPTPPQMAPPDVGQEAQVGP